MIRKLAALLTANLFIQTILHYNVILSQYLQGIGAGSSVGASGEGSLLKRLAAKEIIRCCILDVGANQGQYAKQVLSHFEKDAVDLHCFEPSPTTYRILTDALMGYPNLNLNNMALGNQAGSAKLYSDKEGSGLASLTKRKLDHFGITFTRSEDVIVDTVDHYCEVHGIIHIDLLKIDVEGHELDVLQGADCMLKTGKVDMVTFEFGGCNIDTRTYFQDFFYFFLERQMSIYRITPSGYLMRILKYAEIQEQFRTANYVALRD